MTAPKHKRACPPAQWIRSFVIRARWEWGTPPSWDQDAVDEWVQSLEPWQWTQMRDAWRGSTYRRNTSTKQQVERAGMMGLFSHDALANGILYEAYKNSRRDWKAFIDVMPPEMKATAEMIHLNNPDSNPWEAVSRVLMRGMIHAA